MNIFELKNIGLTEGEVKIYSALLELGETTRTKLAKKSGISPSKIYDVANRLLEKGIISSVKKQGVIHFSAADPERLKDFLQHKEKEIQREKQIVNSLLPSLLAKYQKTQDDADVEVFYGWKGMRTAYDGIAKTLGKNDENLIFGASMGKDYKKADLFFRQYRKKVQKKGYKIKVIFNEDVRGHSQRDSFYRRGKHETKYLLQNTFTEINLYKNTVLFVMLLEKPIVIRVKSKEAADSFRKFFDTMWTMAKP